ncbi:MAG: hypothetical protein NTW87_13975 [Planctomycetota bacterium]|nr:hypothetical protein [Planctomycetota bacterium]
MVQDDALEGIIDHSWWFHYDMTRDVLYLRLTQHLNTETSAEETPDGFLLLRTTHDDAPVGITVVNWWKRFGSGKRPDSIAELEKQIEPWARKVAA